MYCTVLSVESNTICIISTVVRCWCSAIIVDPELGILLMLINVQLISLLSPTYYCSMCVSSNDNNEYRQFSRVWKATRGVLLTSERSEKTAPPLSEGK